MKKRDSKIMLWVAIILFLAVLFIAYTTFRHYSPYVFGLERYEKYANVTVTEDSMAWELVKNATALTFGKVKSDSSSSRHVIINNTYDFPVRALITSKGKISPLLNYNPDVRIDKGEAKEIDFTVTIPDIANMTNLTGYYDGFVHFKIVPAV